MTSILLFFFSMPEFLALHPLVNALVDSHNCSKIDHNETFISQRVFWPESRFCHAYVFVRTDS